MSLTCDVNTILCNKTVEAVMEFCNENGICCMPTPQSQLLHPFCKCEEMYTGKFCQEIKFAEVVKHYTADMDFLRWSLIIGFAAILVVIILSVFIIVCRIGRINK